MNEDDEQRQDGDEENMDETVQKMFDDLKNLLAKKNCKKFISTFKQKMDDLCVDADNNSQVLPNTQKQKVDNTEPIASSEVNKQVEVKEEIEDNIVGTIKVKNLSLLMDPNRNKQFVEETIVLSDSDEDNSSLPQNIKSTESTAIENGDIAIVMQNADKDAICDNLAFPTSKSGNLSGHTKHTSKEKSRNNDTTDTNSNTKPQSSTKSILKSPIKRTPSPEKKVKFSKSNAEVHTYLRYSPSASDSSSEDLSSDEEFTIKSTKKKKPRNKVVQPKETKNVQYAEHIRQDKKYFSKCVVNVQRVSIDNLSNLLNKGEEDESRTDEIKRMNNMDGLKRKHLERNGNNADTSVDKRKQEKAPKRSKKHTSEDKDKLTQKTSYEKNGDTKKATAGKSGDSIFDEEPEETNNKDGLNNIHSEETYVDDAAHDITETNDHANLFSSESEEENVCTSAKKKKKSKPVLSDSDESCSGSSVKVNSTQFTDSSDRSEEEEKKRPAKKSKKRSRIKKVDDSSDDEVTTRKQIRKVISRDSLADTTKQAERDEAERKARIAERQAKYNNIFDPKALESTVQTKLVLDFNEETQEELLTVDEELVKHLKPHQAKGIQFMWDACFESIERTKNTNGSGCILAHCMGLGKTLQVVTLTHTLLSNQDKTGVSKVLVVCPLSTVLNWVAEYKQWLPDDDEVQVYNLVAYKQNRERIAHVMDWHKHGGVLVLGYDMFRNLSNETNKRVTKKMRLDFCKALVDPGPDLVVCDEGHLLKNGNTSLSKAMNRIKSLRRIILTGTPLQNNLKEYHCMVQFVKPNLLGTYKEYLNRFVNPITNGQYTDSTPADIDLMRKRSHVLHKLLDGTVQRRDYAVLAPFLPPKHEYVVFISLTETQSKLYRHYLTNFAQRAAAGRTSLFADFQELQRICTHPRVLLDKSIQNKALADKKWDDEEDEEDSEGSLKNFIDDSDEESEAKSSTSSDSGSEKESSASTKYTRRTRANAENEPEEAQEDTVAQANIEWWSQFTEEDELHNIVHSGKLSLLFEILHQCELIGDKILVFSQSLLSLNVIEYFLSKIDEAAQNGDSSMVKGYSGSWSLGLDYFRLDGSSSCDNRAAWCKTFNDPTNIRARLFLISTRAGGLGINLVAANRVIIFDVSWNPSHDIQSIYRVYRFGQIKPSFIYRFVTLGTMEMKVYERQVTKQAISKRVIDEQQIDRHYNQNDLQELYKFDPQPSERPPPVPPKDILLGELLQNFEDVIFKYHEHQSLLENKEDEVLNEAERKAAWEEFENEKKMQRNSSGTINNIPMHIVTGALKSILMREHPSLTDQEISGVMPQVINELKGQLAAGDMGTFNKMLAEIRAIKAAEQFRVQQYLQQQQLLAHFQRQFPGQDPAVIERFFNAQMANPQLSAFAGRPAAPRSTAATVSNAPRNISSEIVNLDED